MKNKFINIAIVIILISQVLLFIISDYVDIRKEEEVITTHKEYTLSLEDVIYNLKSFEEFNIKKVSRDNAGYLISGEIIGNKNDIEKLLSIINYFGIISYTITIDDKIIHLSLTMRERLNNNCI